MVTNADETPTTTRADEFDGAFRVAIAGDRRGAVRRIILYGVTIMLMMLAFTLPLALVPAAITLMLLAMTDQFA